jgi:PAS domain S-box-containing protein
MPFDTGFKVNPWVEKLLAVRERPFLSYAIAVGLVLVAILMRWAVSEAVGPQVPFITFYPAIIVAALIGGLWPGIVATALSTVAAWYAFIPPEGSFELVTHRALQLLLFLFINGVNIAVSVLLNAVVSRLVVQQRNIRLLLDSASNGFLLVDGDGRIRLANTAVEKLFGYKAEELIGKDVEVLIPPGAVEAHRKQRRQYQERPDVRQMGAGRDLSGRHRDGTAFPLEIGLNPVGRDRKPAVLATVIDITGRKTAEEMQRVIVQELQHRMRNAMSVVQAIVDNTLREKRDLDEARKTLSGRLMALSRAYNLITPEGEGVSVARVIGPQVAPYGDRVAVQGCEVPMPSRIAQHFSLVVHELTTNAVKYGALSGPSGIVSIGGQGKAGGLFVFTWQEQGGPAVTPPGRKGFGTALLDQATQYIARRVTLDYRPGGLFYDVELDLGSDGELGEAQMATA